MNKHGELYHTLGDYENAELSYKNSMDIREKLFGQEHPDYAICCNNLGLLFQQKGEYRQSERLHQNAIKIRQKLFGKLHPHYLISCNNLGVLYCEMGLFQRAEKYHLEALAGNESNYGKENEKYAQSCDNLAVVYAETGRLQEAIALCHKAERIKEKIYGKQHIEYAINCNNLASYYMDFGDYNKAELYTLESLDIVKSLHGENHFYYIFSENNLAYHYSHTSKKEKAEEIFKNVVDKYEAMLGREHPYYLMCLQNHIANKISMEKYDEAEKLLLESDVLSHNSSINYKTLTAYYLNLVDLYVVSMEYEKALQSLLEIRQVIENKYESKQAYIENTRKLGYLWKIQANFEKAEKHYLQALDIVQQTYEQGNYEFNICYNNLCFLYYAFDKYAMALEYYNKAGLKGFKKLAKNRFNFFTEKEKLSFLDYGKKLIDSYYSLSFMAKKRFPNASVIAYNTALFSKSLVLNSSRQLRKAINEAENTEDLNAFNQVLMHKATIVKENLKEESKKLINTDSLAVVVNSLEKKLVRKYPKSDPIKFETDFNDVKNSLNDYELAVEFASFRFRDKKGITDSVYYCALILDKNMEYPEMLYLCKEQELESILKGQKPQRIYGFSRNATDFSDTGVNNGSNLHQVLIKPMEKYLKGKNTLFFSLTGLLHKLSFNAISFNDSSYLSDIYDIHVVSSTAKLLEKQEFRLVDYTTAQLFGGIVYDFDSLSFVDNFNHNMYTKELLAKRSEIRSLRRGMPYLEGTKKEVETIHGLFKIKGLESKINIGESVVEESLKSLSGNNSPQVLHIATHGFYEKRKEEKNKNNDDLVDLSSKNTLTKIYHENPMARSGLLFAGANRAFSGKEPIEGIDDGILTAEEVSNLYFPNTRLAVLSACQTGLGEDRGSEGVFGLQRGFKMAGVEYLVMSLWEVPDYPTQQLMTKFYSNLIAGQEIRTAFRDAQNMMKEKYRDTPQNWAGFVLIN